MVLLVWLGVVVIVPVAVAILRVELRDDRRRPRAIPLRWARPSRPQTLERIARRLAAEPLRTPTSPGTPAPERFAKGSLPPPLAGDAPPESRLPTAVDAYVASALRATGTRLPTSPDDEVTELWIPPRIT